MATDRRLAMIISITAFAVAGIALVFSGDLKPLEAAALWVVLSAGAAWTFASVTTGSPGPQSAPVSLDQAPGQDALIAVLPGATILLSANDTILAFNSEARTLMAGLRKGLPLTVATRHPDLLGAIRQARLSGSAQRLLYEERVPIERRIAAVVAPVGGEAPAHLIVALSDQTEIARTEQMRADFVANASHELRTPLTALKGSIETLQGPAREDPAAREKFLAIMASQASRMTGLIDDLMSLSKIEMREHVAPDGAADMSAIIRRTVEGLEVLARDADARLLVEAADQPAIVRGDAGELEQVVQNLVQNAIKYGRKGGTVRIGISRGEGRVTIRVADDGPGIAAEHLPRLTERFYRVDAPASRNRGGTGLGLAIVKHILNRHRGELVIASELGKGSVFTVVLPSK